MLAQADPVKITYWDFFGGGDGIRMKQIVEEFNKSQQEIQVVQTTLTWGEPFYTKVHTAVVSGQTPDVMSYHLSRFATGIASGRPQTTYLRGTRQAGLKVSDFQKSIVERSLRRARFTEKPTSFLASRSIFTPWSSTITRTLFRRRACWMPTASPMGLESHRVVQEDG